MIRNPLRHPNWDDVEKLQDVTAAFNIADTTLARQWSKGGPDGTGTAYHHIDRAVYAALVEVFEWAGFSQPTWWAERVMRYSLESGERYSNSYRHILDHESLIYSDLDSIAKTGV
jgi:hypothetical protein